MRVRILCLLAGGLCEVAASGCGRFGYASIADIPPPPDAIGSEAATAGLVRITDNGGLSSSPALALSSSGVAAVWDDELEGTRQIAYSTLDVAGSPRTPPSVVSTSENGATDPELVVTPDGAFAAWTDDAGSGTEIVLARVDAADPTSQWRLRLGAGRANGSDPSVAWSGSLIAAVWEEDRGSGQGAVFAVVAPDGEWVVEPTSLDSEGSARDVYVVWMADQFTAVWVDERHEQDEIYGAAFNEAGEVVVPEVRLTEGDHDAGEPRLAVWPDGNGALAFERGTNESDEIYLTLLGRALDPVEPVSLTPDAGDASDFALAVGDREMALVWRNRLPDYRSELRFTRVTEYPPDEPASSVIASVTDELEQPALIAVPGGYLTAWTDDRFGNREIVALSLLGSAKR